MPKISIIVPNRNHGRYLPELFESLRKDSMAGALELILIDDASSDNSVAVAKREAGKCPFPTNLIEMRVSIGPVEANMLGLQSARAPYCLFRSADDLCVDGFLEGAYRLLEANPEIGLCAGELSYFEDASESNATERPLALRTEAVLSPTELARALKGGTLYTHSSVLRVEAIEALGGMDAELAWYADWLLTMEVAFSRGIAYLPQPGCRCRLESESFGTKSLMEADRQYAVFAAVLDALLDPKREAVFGCFCMASSTAFFPLGILEPFFLESRFWTNKAFNLLQTPLWRWNEEQEQRGKQGISHVVREKLREAETRLFETWRECGKKGLYVYGAGSHTKSLLSLWALLELPPLDGIIVTRKEPGDDYAYGLPVFQADELEGSLPKLILISSKSFQSQMRDTCRQFFHEAERLEFWR